jgi:hemerythrin-like domain-containing protein
MVSIPPSSVRQRILREHGALRVMIGEMRHVVALLPHGGKAQLARARVLADKLCDELVQHLDLEELMLVPAPREADAWGPVRAETLVEHHAEQRREFTALRHASIAPHDADALAKKLTDFVDSLETDMVHEERDLLGCLRDDVLGIEVEDG